VCEGGFAQRHRCAICHLGPKNHLVFNEMTMAA
jgi:hypothetical protein